MPMVSLAVTGKTNLARINRLYEILELRKQGRTYKEIEEITGVERSNAHGMVKKWVLAASASGRDELRAIENEKLNELQRVAMEAITAFVPVMYQGEVVMAPLIGPDGTIVTDPNGKPLMASVRDRAPVLAGVAAALRIAERRAKLFGLDAPLRQEIANTKEAPKELTFRVVRATDGRPADLMQATIEGAHLSPDEMQEVQTRVAMASPTIGDAD